MRKTLIVIGLVIAALFLVFAATSPAMPAECSPLTWPRTSEPLCISAPTILRPLPLPETGQPRIIHPSPIKPRVIYPSPPKPVR